MLNGESPVSHGHPAGQRLGLTKTSEPLLRAKGEKIAARFMNWSRISNPEHGDEGAILFSEAEPNRGRIAFYAFSETVWKSRPT